VLGLGGERLAAVPLAALGQHAQNQLRSRRQLTGFVAGDRNTIIAITADVIAVAATLGRCPFGSPRRSSVYARFRRRPGADEVSAGAKLTQWGIDHDKAPSFCSCGGQCLDRAATKLR